MGPFWPGIIATFLASMVTLTSTTRSNGGCESEDDHHYLIKHRFVFCVLYFLSILSYWGKLTQKWQEQFAKVFEQWNLQKHKFCQIAKCQMAINSCVIYNCSVFGSGQFCVSFSRGRKSERIERNLKHKIRPIETRETRMVNHNVRKEPIYDVEYI